MRINENIIITDLCDGKKNVESVIIKEKRKRFQLIYDTAQKYEGGTTFVAAAVAKELGIKTATVYNILLRIRKGEIIIER